MWGSRESPTPDPDPAASDARGTDRRVTWVGLGVCVWEGVPGYSEGQSLLLQPGDSVSVLSLSLGAGQGPSWALLMGLED